MTLRNECHNSPVDLCLDIHMYIQLSTLLLYSSHWKLLTRRTKKILTGPGLLNIAV